MNPLKAFSNRVEYGDIEFSIPPRSPIYDSR
jgi:hypothetical protein